MKKIFLGIFLFLSFYQVSSAQLRIRTNGQILVGTSLEDDALDMHNYLQMNIFGPHGAYGAGSRVAFGDQASRYTQNVMIGERSETDTDQLMLHGRKGVYINTGIGQTEDPIGFYDLNLGEYFQFSRVVRAPEFFVTSDSCAKQNIQPLESNSKLYDINAISYEFKQQEQASARMAQHLKPSDSIKIETKTKLPQTHYGYIAQDVAKIFPHLVMTDAKGEMSINYMGLIPLITESLKEQNKQLRQQEERIKIMEARIDLLESQLSNKAVKKANLEDIPELFQNVPNPFNSQTEIGYYLPSDVKTAVLYICNLQGSLVKQEIITERGRSSYILSASSLQPGIYYYSLTADGIEIDTKRMILTN